MQFLFTINFYFSKMPYNRSALFSTHQSSSCGTIEKIVRQLEHKLTRNCRTCPLLSRPEQPSSLPASRKSRTKTRTLTHFWDTLLIKSTSKMPRRLWSHNGSKFNSRLRSWLVWSKKASTTEKAQGSFGWNMQLSYHILKHCVCIFQTFPRRRHILSAFSAFVAQFARKEEQTWAPSKLSVEQ